MKPESRGLDLFAFLIKPVQRICKYPLLLKELSKYTSDDHSDYADLKQAFDEIADLVDFINESKRKREELEQLIAKLEFDDVRRELTLGTSTTTRN